MRIAMWIGAVLTALVVGAPAWAAGPVLLNRATAEQLAAIDGVDAALAGRIVALRAQRGRLDSVEQLRVVSGITETALDALRQGTWIEVEFPVGTRKAYASADEVLAEFDDEPDVATVQGWAASYAQVEAATVRKWISASRAFAVLPQVRFEYRVKDDYQNDFRAYDELGNPPTSNDVDTVNVLTDADVGQDRTILVRATWDLDQLVMSSEQIRVLNEAQDVVKLREKVLGEVTRLYFERRRLQVDMLLSPKPDVMGQVRDELRLRELTASLDAYTGGQLSRHLASGS